MFASRRVSWDFSKRRARLGSAHLNRRCLAAGSPQRDYDVSPAPPCSPDPVPRGRSGRKAARAASSREAPRERWRAPATARVGNGRRRPAGRLAYAQGVRGPASSALECAVRPASSAPRGAQRDRGVVSADRGSTAALAQVPPGDFCPTRPVPTMAFLRVNLLDPNRRQDGRRSYPAPRRDQIPIVICVVLGSVRYGLRS